MSKLRKVSFGLFFMLIIFSFQNCGQVQLQDQNLTQPDEHYQNSDPDDFNLNLSYPTTGYKPCNISNEVDCNFRNHSNNVRLIFSSPKTYLISSSSAIGADLSSTVFKDYKVMITTDSGKNFFSPPNDIIPAKQNGYPRIIFDSKDQIYIIWEIYKDNASYEKEINILSFHKKTGVWSNKKLSIINKCQFNGAKTLSNDLIFLYGQCLDSGGTAFTFDKDFAHFKKIENFAVETTSFDDAIIAFDNCIYLSGFRYKSGIVYSGSTESMGSVQKSCDNGESWSMESLGLSLNDKWQGISNFIEAKKNLYAFLYSDTGFYRLKQEVDQSWSITAIKSSGVHLENIVSVSECVLVGSGYNSSVRLTTLYVSKDCGENWRESSNQPGSPVNITSFGKNIFLSTHSLGLLIKKHILEF